MFNTNLVFAEFGESCTTVINSNQMGLQNKSLYGYIIKNIKIKDLKDNVGCNLNKKEIAGSRSITIGVRKEADSDEVIEINFKENQETTIGSISGSYLSKIPILKDIKVKPEVSSDSKSLCLTMRTQYGKAYLLCRALEKHSPKEEEIPEPAPCTSTLSRACFQSSENSNSKIFFSFSGQLMECVRESVKNIIYQDNQCGKDKIKFNINSISIFRSELSKYVGFMLTIYIIFYGFKMAADPANFSTQDIILSVIKVVIVVALTSGPTLGLFSGGINKNLLDEYVLPLALDLMDLFSSAVTNSNGSGLCAFDSGSYPSGYKYYALFDAIDCRIAYYTVITPEVSEDTNLIVALPVIILFMLIGGHLVLCLCLATFLIFFFDIIFKFIAAIIVYIVTLYAMVYVSIIYIPTILFEKTKRYYDSWQKIFVSMIIQPFVLTAFLVMFFNVFDGVFFKDCEFQKELIPNQSGREKFFFTVSNGTSEKCKSSFGYTLLQYQNKENWTTVRLILFKISIPKIIFGFENPFVYIEIVMWIIIFHFIMEYSYSMAAQISDGPAVLLEKMKKNKGEDKKKNAPDKKAGKDKDKASADGGGDKDKASADGGGDKDKASADGGGGDKDETNASCGSGENED